MFHLIILNMSSNELEMLHSYTERKLNTCFTELHGNALEL